jgi:tetratricopeptide (TPR) repeat protein
MKFVFFILALFGCQLIVGRSVDPQFYAKQLSINDEQQSKRFNDILDTFASFQPDTSRLLYQQITAILNKSGDEFAILRNNILGYYIPLPQGVTRDVDSEKVRIRMLVSRAETMANDMLLADVSYVGGVVLFNFSQLEESALYLTKSIEIVERLGPEKFFRIFNRYRVMGDLFYLTREYEKSIYYSKKGLDALPAAHAESLAKVLYNIIGLCYRKLGVADSAIFYFDKSAEATAADKNRKDNLWITIPQGNKAQVYFQQKRYAEATPLFWADYNECMKAGILYDAANNLQWLAKVDLVYNKKDSAVWKARKALQMLKVSPMPNYLQNTYETLSSIFRQMNNSDSAVYYSLLYTRLHDSIELVAARSQGEIIRLRLNDEKNRNAIKALEQQQQIEKMKRNGFISVVVLLAFLVYLALNRKQQKLKQEKQVREAELAAAREQMKMFTRTITEKSDLLDQVQLQLEQQKLAPELAQNLGQLRTRTILTEEDWTSFQNLFEKIYPGFFKKLKEHTPDITHAELRFSALIKLDLTNRQAATMLGISGDSARKTRLRLRQRLRLPEEHTLEGFIQGL